MNYKQPLPTPTRCPNCGHVDRTTVCRYCGTDKVAKRKPSDQEKIFHKALSGMFLNLMVKT